MDKLQWFKFTPTDWIMGKIQRCPEITQARFLRLICLYWNKGCLLTYEDAEIEIDKEHLDLLIDKKIIKLVENFISIEFLNEQLVNISETSQKRREAVLLRWAKAKKNDTIVLQNNTSVLQSDTDKSREDKSILEIQPKVVINWDSLLTQFNNLTKREFKLINDATKKQILTRLKEGYTKEDLWNAIQNCYNDDFHKENNHKYLTLEFISRAKMMEKYSVDVVKSKKIDKSEIGKL
jgi:uncharacterized phage protein (TIGR02220 family)